MTACHHGHIKILNLLLTRADIDVNAQSQAGGPNHSKVPHIFFLWNLVLVSKSHFFLAQGGMTALMRAAEYSYFDHVGALLAHDVNADLENEVIGTLHII